MYTYVAPGACPICTDTCPIGRKTEDPDSSLNQPYFLQVKTDDTA